MSNIDYTPIPLVPDDSGTLSIGVHEVSTSNSCNSIAYPLFMIVVIGVFAFLLIRRIIRKCKGGSNHE